MQHRRSGFKMHQNCSTVSGVFQFLLTISLFLNYECNAQHKRAMLSDYIKNGDIAVARSLSEVNSPCMLNVKSYAGHLTVSQREADVNLWFWYFPIEDKTPDAPLVLWLQGGPSISSLIGVFGGVGPFNYENENITKNPYSWNKNHSILFIDSPVGTGFSYTSSDDGYSTNLTEVSENLYGFLLQFYQMFSELREVPLFLSGQSYAGKFIPSLAYKIHNENLSSKDKINLKGMTIGNGWIDPINLISISSTAHAVGLVDYNTKMQMEIFENNLKEAHAAGNWKQANTMLTSSLDVLKFQSELPYLYNYVSERDCYDPSYTEFIERNTTKKSLHVSDITYSWRDMKTREKLDPDKMTSVVPLLEKLLEHYPVLVYNGQLDLMVPYANLEKVYRSLKWSGSGAYETATRDVLAVDRTLIGYTKRAGNFQEVFIRNVGHCVTSEIPEYVMKMITSFTHNKGIFSYEKNSDTTKLNFEP